MATEAYQDDDYLDDELDAIEAEIRAAVERELSSPPTDDEAALISQGIMDLENEAGFQLVDDDFERVRELAHQYGDAETAFNLVVSEAQEAEGAWHEEFDRGVEALQEQLGRTLTKAECEKLIDHHEEESDPDVAGAWEQLYGKRFTDDDIAAVEAEHHAELERLRDEGYSAEFRQKFEQENGERVSERVADMRRSGLGEHDLDDAAERAEYVDVTFSLKGAVPELADDVPSSTAANYIDARINGATREDAAEETGATFDRESFERLVVDDGDAAEE